MLRFKLFLVLIAVVLERFIGFDAVLSGMVMLLMMLLREGMVVCWVVVVVVVVEVVGLLFGSRLNL